MRFESLLNERGIDYEKHTHAKTFTSQALANVEHVSGYTVAKPVIVKGDAGYVMCVLPAPNHLDMRRVAELLNDPHVRLATEPEMAGVFTDCELGAEPPVGSLYGMKTIEDTRLREPEYLVMQDGSHTEAIRLRREDWERVCEPVAAAIAAG